MSETDWLDTPLQDFSSKLERQENGTSMDRFYPLGKGIAQRLIVSLIVEVEHTYWKPLSEEEADRAEATGEVPILMRDGGRTYKDLDKLTLRDLPAILDTFAMLEDELRRQEREESERKAAQSNKARRRALDKERRKLKELGEW